MGFYHEKKDNNSDFVSFGSYPMPTYKPRVWLPHTLNYLYPLPCLRHNTGTPVLYCRRF